ncbi:MAG: hypothetical protein INR62_13470 [Rhodospirillales bacterium]|nr:hypothetical protein [Acetobacter sp.]
MGGAIRCAKPSTGGGWDIRWNLLVIMDDEKGHVAEDDIDYIALLIQTRRIGPQVAHHRTPQRFVK